MSSIQSSFEVNFFCNFLLVWINKSTSFRSLNKMKTNARTQVSGRDKFFSNNLLKFCSGSEGSCSIITGEIVRLVIIQL